MQINECYGLDVYVPWKFIYWNPSVQCDGIKWGFDMYLGHKGGVLMNRSACMKDPRELLSPFHHVKAKQKTAVYEPENPQLTPSASTMILNFSTSRNMRNKCLLFITYPVYRYFIIAAQED